MSKIILLAETGSDLKHEQAAANGITLVPMHVTLGMETIDDGSIPTREVFDTYKRTRKLPRTSGCTPGDFEPVFDRLLADPDVEILYLAYSACTTCSMHSAELAAEGRDRITMIDTKNVAAGQGAIVLHVAKTLRENPDMTMAEAVKVAENAIARVRMGFFPGDLDYLRAGGRVSNAAYLGATILGLHPLIEIQDGKLMSTKKYRGNMARVIGKLTDEYPAAQNFDTSMPVYLIFGDGLAQSIREDVENKLRAQGFAELSWVETGCVIGSHSGPGSFGIVGFAK